METFGEEFGHAMLLAAMAGGAIPAGAGLALIERFLPGWLEMETRHAVIAFGGGILLAAVAFVLVPHGQAVLSMWMVALSIAAGGLLFMVIDRALQRSGASVAQTLAMLLDFVPEAIALGALLATGAPTVLLLAVIIGLQNLPEGFNAYRELSASRRTPSGARAFAILTGCAFLGPLAAAFGFIVLGDREGVVATIMLVASGGILYLTFQDIAPQARLDRAWAPPFGAVAGFLAGLVGQMTLGGG
ncbi:hypothetical protein KAJ83_07790 [Marivibrio halodurans]|uniref:Divalent cation transporter n=1 Tax=Marivibrio halodurans TaxID=2039722 RepID=A0A8J7V212_9PROT|nr:hypothetical protein [Marivibrio halodurans]MBP5856905.1 hypothetical protein [Marivibrio halodurans]